MSVQIKKYDKALEYLQQSLIKVSLNFNADDIYQNPTVAEPTLSIQEKPVILLWKSRALYEKAIATPTVNKQLLEEAAKVGQLAYATSRIGLNNFIGYENSVIVKQNGLAIALDNLIKVYHQLYRLSQDQQYLHQIFQYMEEKKVIIAFKYPIS